MHTTPKRRRLDRLRVALIAAGIIEAEPLLDPSGYPPAERQARVALAELELSDPPVAALDAVLRLVAAVIAARDASPR